MTKAEQILKLAEEVANMMNDLDRINAFINDDESSLTDPCVRHLQERVATKAGYLVFGKKGKNDE